MAERVASAHAYEQAENRGVRDEVPGSASHGRRGHAETWPGGFMWFGVEGRFLPVVDEWDGPPVPSDAAYDEARRLTVALARCQLARTIPPADVLRWLTEDDRAEIGLRRRRVAA